METKILDGTGTGNRAKVNSQGQINTFSVTRSELSSSLDKGKAWNLGTGYLTLTTANASDILYIKNTGTLALFIDLYVVLARASTGGTGDLLIDILRNPTAGTVVSDATSANAVNMNFGSNEQPTGLFYKGGEGKTLTGNDAVIRSKTTADNRWLAGILTEIPKGSSLGFRVTPPTGNTSIDIEVIIEIYEELQ